MSNNHLLCQRYDCYYTKAPTRLSLFNPNTHLFITLNLSKKPINLFYFIIFLSDQTLSLPDLNPTLISVVVIFEHVEDPSSSLQLLGQDRAWKIGLRLNITRITRHRECTSDGLPLGDHQLNIGHYTAYSHSSSCLSQYPVL